MTRTKDYYHRRAAEIIERIHYATLATVTANGEPWNSPVYAVHDEDGNFYWSSDKDNQHSRNVCRSGHAFIVIYDSTAPEGEGEGVYIKAQVMELKPFEEIGMAERLKGVQVDDPASLMGTSIRRVYKAMPQAIWMNDAEVQNGVFIRDYRVELSLEGLRKRLRGRSI